METGVDSTVGSLGVGEDKLFVAVGNDIEKNTSTLLWALKNFRKKLNFCILHVHQPALEIRIMGVNFRVEALDAQQVRAYRQKEREKMNKILNDYVDICLHAGVHAETINIEKDNIESGILELIVQHGITKLVMGAASDRHYSKQMVKPRSQKANFVFKNAPISCNIWFVCKQKVIATSEGVSEKIAMEATTSQSDQSRARPFINKSLSHNDGLSGNQVKELLRRAQSTNSETTRESESSRKKSQSPNKVLTNPFQDLLHRAFSRNKEPSSGKITRTSSSSSSLRSLSQSTDRSSSRLSIGSSSGRILSDDETVASSLCESIENLNGSSPAYELSLEKESGSIHEEGTPNKEQLEREREELEKLRSQRDQVMKEIQIAQDQKVKLVSQISDSDRMVTELVAMQKEFASLQRPQFFSVISALDIESATESFNPSMKIGEGGFGNVYKGLLRQTPVAIKRFHFHSLEEQSNSDFQREVNVLSKVRHPNLVTLIGACPEASSLVFEYLVNGSLEDRLTCKDDTPPLSWKIRFRIAMEICSALIFLHSNEPDSIVHGDLKPSNILLDVNFVSKLGDFGIASFITRDENSSYTRTLCCTADLKGTIAYIDPEFFATGVLTPKADVYSFGVVVLQLLTGRSAVGLAQKVKCALDQGTLNAMLDASAGDWPLVQAKKLVQMALRCCELSRKDRPNLELDVLKLLQSLEIQI
ncbi:hypothetical protein NE237_024795 [Protea cynaroides]|uniref:RING-type E3 ubiquitin transferase n=1 Tax=Protea cynaroides TaxID=273540 RepID=A0A9Q0H5U3_9MAGN|nr:hypothetical protein NE237_024795 [Protea cynaroides]